METLEREYLSAMSASRRDITTGRTCVERMLREHPNQTRARMFAAHLSFHDDLRNCGTALQTMLDDVIPTSISNNDMSTTAMSFVIATKLATDINEVTAVDRLVPMLDAFWTSNAGNDSIEKWRFGCGLNVGVHYLRNGRLAEAIDQFTTLIELAVEPRYVSWLTKLHAQLAVAYARLGDTAQARIHAEIAETTGLVFNKQDRLYAWGEIAVAESNWDTAKSLFINAYRYAREYGDYYVMAYAQVMLARVYQTIGNVDAFWYAYDLAHELSRSHGIPHVFGVLADVAAGVPMNVREEVERA